MRELQNDLKPLLEGFARGFIEADKKDGKSWIIGKGATILSRHLQKNKKNKGADIYKICSTPLLNISIFYNFSILPIIELSSIFH